MKTCTHCGILRDEMSRLEGALASPALRVKTRDRLRAALDEKTLILRAHQDVCPQVRAELVELTRKRLVAAHVLDKARDEFTAAQASYRTAEADLAAFYARVSGGGKA